jgi:phage shock protein E
MKHGILMVFASALLATPGLAADPPAATPATPAAAAPVSKNTSPLVSPGELKKRLDAKDPNVVVLDVRSIGEFEAGHVPGAKHIPHDALASRLSELAASRDQEVVVYCRSGRRAGLAEDILRGAGFTKVKHLEGDYPGWEGAQKPAEATPTAPATK